MTLRLLYLPNEGSRGDQLGPREGFEYLFKTERLEAYEAFSFLVEARELGSWDVMLDKLVDVSEVFQPSAILWCLQNNGIVPKRYVAKLKSLASRPIIAQRTGDSYWKPPREMVELGREIDVTFLTGTSLIPAFKKQGCKVVRYHPEVFDTVRFGKPWQRTKSADYDVVMISNFYNQLWFKRYPGQKERMALAYAFSKHFGKRFGLFGDGWKGWRCWQGKIPYDQQQEPMRSSWLVLGVNNWQDSHYFSDRLPISLSSGVPVVYKYFTGAEELFEDSKHLWFFEDVNDAMKKARHLLDMPVEQRESVARYGSAYAIARYSHRPWTSCMVKALEDIGAGRADAPWFSGFSGA